MSKNYSQCKKIKLVLTDVDGVLTDGGRYYSSTGEQLKKFHARDGMGVNILLRNNIKTIIVSKEKSTLLKRWCKEMNISEVLVGRKNKELILTKICKKYQVTSDEIAFIGDDVNDIKLLQIIGFSGAPKDAIDLVKKSVNYICSCNGGDGAFREFIDYILIKKFSKEVNWY